RNCPPSLLTGTFLVIINFPVGWIGLAWFAHIAKIKDNVRFYYIGACFYVLSWVLLLFGIFLCGKNYAKSIFLKYHTPIIAITALAIISIAVFSLYFSKKPSKINEKTV
ncbi:MAG: hypothetical protein LBL00_00055, partial [Endomicrobium sp.]|nr:hypothetical protein [Endomicrobium sp.]